MKIEIAEVSCIKCGKCVRVCPSVIFSQSGAKNKIEVTNQEGCIVCGHCVAACPTASVIHSDFPLGTVHPINYTAMPTPEQVMLLLKSRRSNRAFSKQAIPEEMLSQILEAAHRAPTASNMQQVEFTLITDPEKLRAITDYTVDVFSSIVKKLKNPIIKFCMKPFMAAVYRYLPQFDRLIAERDAGRDLILRGATAVIFIHTPKNSRFGCQDANLAYQNGSLMAESMGVSQFYTGFVCSAIKQDKDNKLAQQLDIDGTIHAGMALGMPQFRYPNYIDRKEIITNNVSSTKLTL